MKSICSCPILDCPELRGLDGAWFAIECDNAAKFTDCLGEKHRYVTNTTANIKHSHPALNAAVSNQTTGNARDHFGI